MTTSNDRAPTSLSEFIPLEALAKTLGVSKAVVLRWRAALGLPAIRVGQRLYFHEASVAAWLKGRERVEPAAEMPANRGRIGSVRRPAAAVGCPLERVPAQPNF